MAPMTNDPKIRQRPIPKPSAVFLWACFVDEAEWLVGVEGSLQDVADDGELATPGFEEPPTVELEGPVVRPSTPVPFGIAFERGRVECLPDTE